MKNLIAIVTLSLSVSGVQAAPPPMPKKEKPVIRVQVVVDKHTIDAQCTSPALKSLSCVVSCNDLKCKLYLSQSLENVKAKLAEMYPTYTNLTVRKK